MNRIYSSPLHKDYYHAEDTVIKKIEHFSSNKKRLYKTITDISSSSAHSISKLNKELEKIEIRLKEIEQLQAKYMDAFEKNTLPVDILQERLQKVSNDKRGLEQKKNEIIIQLGSVDSKVIQPELIEKLLKKFLSVYKNSSRENKKQLLQLLIDNIAIKQIDRSRTIKNIELDFDFTEMNISKTFILIHLLYRETDNESTFSIPASDKELPPYLQEFLPLFVIRFTRLSVRGKEKVNNELGFALMAVNLRKYTATKSKPIIDDGNKPTKNGSEHQKLLGTIFIYYYWLVLSQPRFNEICSITLFIDMRTEGKVARPKINENYSTKISALIK